VVVRVVKEPENLIVFQHVMDGKAQRNLDFAEMKRAEALKARRSSAWVYLKERVRGEKITVSGGAFPIRLTDGTHVATAVVSGLHEGYDHDLIVEALGNVLGVEAPVFTKALL
ncbi:MAG: heme-binding protein, partial [Solobacterium sp.]|nr:heme-binding protein [Solobacterium sp.]